MGLFAFRNGNAYFSRVLLALTSHMSRCEFHIRIIFSRALLSGRNHRRADINTDCTSVRSDLCGQSPHSLSRTASDISHILACAKLHQAQSPPFYLLEKISRTSRVEISKEIAGIGCTVHQVEFASNGFVHIKRRALCTFTLSKIEERGSTRKD
jgi:hypothetical protein